MIAFFFFQAEDGIRDLTVTGVQTCALPIYPLRGVVRRNQNGHEGHCTPRSADSLSESATALASPAADHSARSGRSEEHTSELQSQSNLVCRLLLEKKKKQRDRLKSGDMCTK